MVSSVVETAIRDFTYAGHPIHPKLVEKFSGWLSDIAPPVVVAVDVSAARQARNEYQEDDIQRDERRVWYQKAQRATFGYEYVGSMTNDVCVLVTWDWGGGSAVFTDLVLVRFHEHPDNGHLLMDVVARCGLGDRGSDHVSVLPDKVEVRAATTNEGRWPRKVIEASECMSAAMGGL